MEREELDLDDVPNVIITIIKIPYFIQKTCPDSTLHLITIMIIIMSNEVARPIQTPVSCQTLKPNRYDIVDSTFNYHPAL